jgi:hypothetical protein
MQLIEIKEKVRNTRIPKAIFDLLWEFEVDPVDEKSSHEQILLTDQMQRAIMQDNLVKVPLSVETQTYLYKQAIPKLIGITPDNALNRLLQQFQGRLDAKLTKAG